MIINEEQIKILKKYIDNLQDLIKNGDVEELLNTIDDLIIDNILANHDEPDYVGIELQRIYDEIYNQN